MSGDIDAVENAWLDGNSQFEEWVVEDERMFFLPLEERMKRIAWAMASDLEKATVRAITPDAVSRVEEEVEE
jgi:hypothetical protein